METPIKDASLRGAIAGALSGVLAFLQVEFNLISPDGATALAPVVVFVALVAGGLWDRYGRPRCG